jgi:hypothetical protein
MLKLTPINRQTIPEAFFSKMPEGDKKDTLAHWLLRGTMQNWYVFPVIQTSEDQDAVRYIIAKVSYPLDYASPSYLQDVIKQAVKETWFLKYEEQKYPLSVKLNEIVQYAPAFKDNFLRGLGILTPKNKPVFFAQHLIYEIRQDASVDYLFPLYPLEFPAGTTFLSGMFLTKLFLCEQVDLLPEEYTFSQLNVYFKVTNKTLYDAEFRVVNEDVYRTKISQDSLESSSTPVETVRVCIDEFEMPNNGNSSCFNASIRSILFIIICLFKICLLNLT